jgi:hypothetical protein
MESRLLRHGINNLVSPKDLHVTLCYSDKHIEGFHPDGYEMSPIRIHPRNARFALFGEGHDVLVLKLFSAAIERRHYQLSSMGFKTKFNPKISAGYSAHMTVSYSHTGDLNTLPLPETLNRLIILNREQMRPLKVDKLNSEDWAIVKKGNS